MPHFDGGPAARLRWAIPARHINTLFGELLPRVAAGVWIGTGDGMLGDFQWPAAGTDATPHIIDWINKFIGDPLNPVPANQLIPASATFKRQLEDLRTYLEFSEPINDGNGEVSPVTMPIRFVAEGAHDYLISSDGMDLFAPPHINLGPDGQEEVLWYYTFRSSGKRPIGVPGVLSGGDGDTSPTLVDAPTGASQLTLPPDVLTKLITCLPGRKPSEFCGVYDAVRQRIEVLMKEEDQPSHETVHDLRCILVDDLGMELGRWKKIEEMLCSDRWIEGYRYICGWLGDQESDDCSPVTIELFECSQVHLRDWQLTGAVFRAIQEVFPRIVADHWHNEIRTKNAEAKDGNAYATVPFTDATAGIREEVRNRLETGLPPKSRMVFSLTDGSDPPGWRSPVWEVDDVMVTNRGVRFPPEMAIPDALGLLSEIVRGRAGNPVFTSTAKCV